MAGLAVPRLLALGLVTIVGGGRVDGAFQPAGASAITREASGSFVFVDPGSGHPDSRCGSAVPLARARQPHRVRHARQRITDRPSGLRDCVAGRGNPECDRAGAAVFRGLLPGRCIHLRQHARFLRSDSSDRPGHLRPSNGSSTRFGKSLPCGTTTTTSSGSRAAVSSCIASCCSCRSPVSPRRRREPGQIRVSVLAQRSPDGLDGPISSARVWRRHFRAISPCCSGTAMSLTGTAKQTR